MGITRRRTHASAADKENDAMHNRASRPWDNSDSLSKFPKLPAPTPVRPPPPRAPTDERFVPLLRANFEQERDRDRAHMQEQEPFREHVAFTSVAASAFVAADNALHEAVAKRERTPNKEPGGGAPTFSVSDRMRLFESEDAQRAVPVRPPSKFPDLNATARVSQALISPSKKPPPIVDGDSPLRTRIGNRDVKPLLVVPKPLPLVGLPIPKPQRLPTHRPDPPKAMQETSRILHPPPEELSRIHELPARHVEPVKLPELAPLPPPPPSPSNLGDVEETSFSKTSSQSTAHMDMEDPDLMPRFSYRHSTRQSVRHSVRHSVRMPTGNFSTSAGDLEAAARTSVRNSRRIGNKDSSDLRFLPDSSSFLDFNDDERLTPLDDNGATKSEETSAGPSVWGGMTFDDPDSFDTFGTLPRDMANTGSAKEVIPEVEPDDPNRPGSNESEKPAFPAMSFTKKSKGHKICERSTRNENDEEDGGLDIPTAFTRRPGAEGALRDLQRASVTAGNELASSLYRMSKAHTQESAHLGRGRTLRKDRASKIQGELLLRSRIFRRWNVRYASVVYQGYFGAVLLLFRPDARGIMPGNVALKNSKMIALTESTVRRVENVRRPGPMLMFELKTSQRTYTFACKDEESRDFWMNSLLSTASG